MEPKASVVVPTYNRYDILTRCLQSLFDQTAAPSTYEVIVIDDGSTDGTPEMVKEMTTKAPCNLIYIRQKNSGRSRARNVGVLAAHGEYIIFLDGDMVVKRAFVTAHLAAHHKPGLVVNGPVVNTPVLVDPNIGPQKIKDFSRAFFATGNVSIAREKLITAGLFDEDFVEYGWEDLELGERLRKMGFKAIKSPAACSFHLQPRLTFENIPSLIAKEKERGHMGVLFYRKNPSSSVKMMTLISPVYFTFDRILTLFHWPERPVTQKLLKRIGGSGRNILFQFLVAIIKSHAYADGIRETLKKSSKF
jgi:glycosyltransferase involved in cell wall biosynthesis